MLTACNNGQGFTVLYGTHIRINISLRLTIGYLHQGITVHNPVFFSFFVTEIGTLK